MASEATQLATAKPNVHWPDAEELDKRFTIIRLLLNRAGDDFAAFCAELRRGGHADLAEKLEYPQYLLAVAYEEINEMYPLEWGP